MNCKINLKKNVFDLIFLLFPMKEKLDLYRLEVIPLNQFEKSQ